MKLGLRKPKRRKGRGHGDVPALPRPMATRFYKGREIHVYETPRGYYATVPGAGARPKMHQTFLEALDEGHALAETMTTRAAYARTRSTRSTRRR